MYYQCKIRQRLRPRIVMGETAGGCSALRGALGTRSFVHCSGRPLTAERDTAGASVGKSGVLY